MSKANIEHPKLVWRNDKDELEPVMVNRHALSERWEWDPDYEPEGENNGSEVREESTDNKGATLHSVQEKPTK